VSICELGSLGQSRGRRGLLGSECCLGRAGRAREPLRSSTKRSVCSRHGQVSAGSGWRGGMARREKPGSSSAELCRCLVAGAQTGVGRGSGAQCVAGRWHRGFAGDIGVGGGICPALHCPWNGGGPVRLPISRSLLLQRSDREPFFCRGPF